MNQFNPQDDQLIRDNFEKFVKNHAGKFVAVSQGKIIFGKSRTEVENKISKLTKILPSVMQIPREKSLTYL